MKTSLFITSGQGRFFLIVVFIHPAIKTRCHPIDGIPYVESALLGGLLAADIGNAHTVLGLLQPAVEGPGHDVLAHWRVGTDERRTADEWAVLLRGLLESPRGAAPLPRVPPAAAPSQPEQGG